jgi:23S rRNA (guanosine2251-2'-O)-methyltransferase
VTTELVYGRRAVREAIRGPRQVFEVFVTERAAKAEPWLSEAEVRLHVKAERELTALAGTADHQGVLARVEPYRYADAYELAAGPAPLLAVLDSVTDPRNLGAVVRSAAGFGAHGVLIPERRSAGMTASAWKTSAGAAARIPVAQATNLTRQLKAYQEAGCMVIGLAADGDVTLPDLQLADGPLVVVVGSEGDGLSRLVAETCDQLVSIPMVNSVESLNAGVAASVTLYAIAQLRGR